MGKYDKDRQQKQLAVRYCLAQGMLPCLEVVVPSASELTSKPEVLTDIDVLGIENVADGNLRRLIFDCKSSARLSAISRVFWASGLMQYTKTDGAFVILGRPALYNHRISALAVNVDLHDEWSFEDLGKSKSEDFNQDTFYQSSIDRWNDVFDAFDKSPWSDELYNLSRNVAPLSQNPERTFRKILVAMKKSRGYVDPTKPGHVAIVFDVLSAILVLWTRMGRDIRRIYSPKMSREDFSHALRLYIWGGQEAFSIRQALFERASHLNSSADLPAEVQEFPAWDRLVHFAGLVVASPQNLFECAHICRELSIRSLAGADTNLDAALLRSTKANRRSSQFITSAISYLTAASQLPVDLEKGMSNVVLKLA